MVPSSLPVYYGRAMHAITYTSVCVNLHTSVRPCTRTWKGVCLQADRQASMPTYRHTYMQTCIRTHTDTVCIHSCTQACTHVHISAGIFGYCGWPGIDCSASQNQVPCPLSSLSERGSARQTCARRCHSHAIASGSGTWSFRSFGCALCIAGRSMLFNYCALLPVRRRLYLATGPAIQTPEKFAFANCETRTLART